MPFKKLIQQSANLETANLEQNLIKNQYLPDHLLPYPGL